MLNSILADFYERDILKLIDEVSLFKNEEDLWKVQGSIMNSSGNLVLHIIGGLNHLIGAKLAQSGYVRNRDLEFTRKGVARTELISGLRALIPMIKETLDALPGDKMDEMYPIWFDDRERTKSYVLIQLLAHLNYHLGQVNYLRRCMEQTKQ